MSVPTQVELGRAEVVKAADWVVEMVVVAMAAGVTVEAEKEEVVKAEAAKEEAAKEVVKVAVAREVVKVG